MCSSPFDCALFGNGLLKLEDLRRERGGGVVRDREICIFVIQAEENSIWYLWKASEWRTKPSKNNMKCFYSIRKGFWGLSAMLAVSDSYIFFRYDSFFSLTACLKVVGSLVVPKFAPRRRCDRCFISPVCALSRRKRITGPRHHSGD